MRRTRIPLWQSIVISIATAAAAVTIYEAVFVSEQEPVVITVAAPQLPPAACEPARPPPAPAVRWTPPLTAQPIEPAAEARARETFERAIHLMRNHETDEGCALLERVAALKHAGIWVEKASSLLERRCD